MNDLELLSYGTIATLVLAWLFVLVVILRQRFLSRRRYFHAWRERQRLLERSRPVRNSYNVKAADPLRISLRVLDGGRR